MEYNELVNAVVSDVVKEACEAPMKEANNPTEIKVDGYIYHFDSIPKGQEDKVKEILHQQNNSYANLSDGEKANIAAAGCYAASFSLSICIGLFLPRVLIVLLLLQIKCFLSFSLSSSTLLKVSQL